ncbi:MAG: M48 family metalloprotease [Planctomycetes bacterium]|jgi:predicted Zn-dependent protease|nr:M48 family metalloprotease [Planctomycetota bacterium]
MLDGLFYSLGRKLGPKIRKAQWMWTSFAGTEEEALRLEYGVGLDLAQEAREQLALDPDPRTRQAVEEVGRGLAACVANQRRSFHFEAFTSREPNAFALPGGFIFVSRSILDLCGWEKSEMAFILGHEMGHVIRGHAIDRIVTNTAVSVASRATPVRGPLGGWLKTVGIQFLQTAYSRDHELEADRLGVRLLQAAGFEAEGSLRLLARLAELGRSTEPSSLGEYFSTHPTSQIRIQSIRRYLLAQP